MGKLRHTQKRDISPYPSEIKDKLLDISTSLLEIAQQVSSLDPRHVAIARNDVTSLRPMTRDKRMFVKLARILYALRRARSNFFSNVDLFGEPAWDFLLDLYIVHCEGKVLPVTSACIGAAVPVTTALRWLNILEREGLVIREQDPEDARRTHVRISDDGITRMELLLGEFDRMMGHPSPAG